MRNALSPAVMKAAGACLHLSRSEPKGIGAVSSSPFAAVLASAGGVMGEFLNIELTASGSLRAIKIIKNDMFSCSTARAPVGFWMGT